MCFFIFFQSCELSNGKEITEDVISLCMIEKGLREQTHCFNIGQRLKIFNLLKFKIYLS